VKDILTRLENPNFSILPKLLFLAKDKDYFQTYDEFQHFIPRFNQISLLCRPHAKRGLGGERRPKREGEDMVTS
jgi:hypothetical protein